MFSTILLSNFQFVKSLLGTLLDWKKMTHKKKSVSTLTRDRYPYKILLQYDQRPSYIILWKRGNFYVPKLLWTNNGFKLILERVKIKSEVNQKCCFDEAKNQAAGSLWSRNFPVSKEFIVLKLDLWKKTHFC